MPNLQIPGSLCQSLHADYVGPTSTKAVLDSIVESARKMIMDVVEAGVPPARLPSIHDPGVNRNVSFPAAIMNIIEEHAFESNLTEGDAIRAYLYAAIARGGALAYRPIIRDGLAPYRAVMGNGFQRRPDQSLLFDCITEVMNKRQIGLVEGATGIGKTLAMVAAASEAVSEGGRAVICTPTIQVLREFIGVHARLEAGMPDLPAKRVALGRPEYISRELLESVLDEGAVAVDAAPIREWLANGAPPLGDDVPLKRNYLASSLQVVCGEFPVEGVRLTEHTPADDPGMLAYRDQFDRDGKEPDREIIYCTHAMVAVDLRRTMQSAAKTEIADEIRANSGAVIAALVAQREAHLEKGEKEKARRIGKEIAAIMAERDIALTDEARDKDFGHLPPWQYLLIDEAHTFETNLAGIMASNISMVKFWSDVRRGAEAGYLPERALKSVNKSLATLRGLADNGDIDLNQVATEQDATRRAVTAARIALAEAAEAVCTSRRKADEPVWITSLRKEAREIKQALEIANKSARTNSCTLQYSPVREFPQLAYGRRSLEHELRFLWGRATAVACVSATLYLRKLDKYSASYMINILRIPNDRVREFPPIRPSWTLSPVIGLWTPEVRQIGNRYWLQPPSRGDRKENDDRFSKAEEDAIRDTWIAQVADAVASIHADAVGGTLVLMTSYSSLHQVAHLLTGRIDALVQANTKTTLTQQRALFIKYALAGRRPVWLALGGAWTGLDVNGAHHGIAAADDNLITDLVIPRIPFGLNSSLTHQHRMDILSAVPWDLLDATMRFKQGIGRLVRRDGLSRNRRIFVLDGRLNDPRFSNYLLPIKQVLELYPQKVLVK